MKNEWSSEPLCPSCGIPSNISTVSINQEVSVEDLLIECLIRDSRSSGNDLDEIPSEYYMLAKSITKPKPDNNN